MTRPIFTRAGAMLSVLGVALTVAACGSSSSKPSTTPAAAPASSSAPASTTPASTASGLTISTAKGADGTYLVGASGRALYLWDADTGGKSNCSSGCAQIWPPVISSGTPKVSGGANASDIGTTTRSDGSKQVTYMGHPLYYYVADPTSGTTKGQGSDSYGAKWWLVATSGTAITSSGSANSSSSSSSGGGGYG